MVYSKERASGIQGQSLRRQGSVNQTPIYPLGPQVTALALIESPQLNMSHGLLATSAPYNRHLDDAFGKKNPLTYLSNRAQKVAESTMKSLAFLSAFHCLHLLLDLA